MGVFGSSMDGISWGRKSFWNRVDRRKRRHIAKSKAKGIPRYSNVGSSTLYSKQKPKRVPRGSVNYKMRKRREVQTGLKDYSKRGRWYY